MHSDNSPNIVLLWQPVAEQQSDWETQSGKSHWLITDTQQNGQNIADLHAAIITSSESTTTPRARDSILIIPAEYTLNARVSVPSAKSVHIQAAVPHLMEEWTLAELDTLHLSMGERSANGLIAVCAIDLKLMTQAIDTIESEGVTCSAIYSDATLLPYAHNTLTILIDGERALFRWNAEQAGAIETDALIPFLSALFQQQSFAAIDLLHTAQAAVNYIEELEKQILSAHRQPLQILRQPAIASLLQFYADQISSAPHRAINLRQGKFAQERSRSKHWLRWKPLAIAASVLFAAQLSLNVIAGWQLVRKADSTHEQTIVLYRELFPEDKRIVNVRQQFQNHLNQNADTDQKPFFTLFGDLTREIQNTTVENPIQLRSLLYDKKSTGLQVELVVPSVPILDDLQKRLSGSGLQAKIASAANVDGVVTGRLTLASKPQ